MLYRRTSQLVPVFSSWPCLTMMPPTMDLLSHFLSSVGTRVMPSKSLLRACWSLRQLWAARPKSSTSCRPRWDLNLSLWFSNSHWSCRGLVQFSLEVWRDRWIVELRWSSACSVLPTQARHVQWSMMKEQPWKPEQRRGPVRKWLQLSY